MTSQISSDALRFTCSSVFRDSSDINVNMQCWDNLEQCIFFLRDPGPFLIS